MKANIKLSLSKLVPVMLLALLRNVIAKLTGSLVYPAPPVAPAAMTTKADALQASIEAATNGSKASKAHRDALVLDVQALLRATADYVRMVANGDRDKLAQSGFELMKQPEPVYLPAIPSKVVANSAAILGAVDVKWPSIHGAHSYEVFIADKDPVNGGAWTRLAVTTRVRYTAKSLESLRNYWFSVSAIGVNGQSMQSAPAMGRAA